MTRVAGSMFISSIPSLHAVLFAFLIGFVVASVQSERISQLWLRVQGQAEVTRMGAFFFVPCPIQRVPTPCLRSVARTVIQALAFGERHPQPAHHARLQH
jgi:hypothetical protein